MALASLFERRENTGPRYNFDLKTSRSFLNRFSWDYGFLGGLTLVISRCCILSFDNAKVRT